MQKKEIRSVSSQAFQALLDIFNDDRRFKALAASYFVESSFSDLVQRAEKSWKTTIDITRFRADQERVPKLLEKASQQPFAVPAPVGVSRVDEVDPVLGGHGQTAQGFPPSVAGAERGQPSRADPQG